MLPDSDRIFAAIGAGYEFDFGFTLDMAYMFTHFVDRTVNGHACTANDPGCLDANGDVIKYTEAGTLNWVGNTFPAHYESHAQLLSVTMGMKF
jgi:long-subunit fatty acid transport protein